MSHGLNAIALPFKQPVEVVLAEIIKTSIRTFSRFKPWERECYVLRKNLVEKYPGSSNQGIYLLPTALTTTEVFDAYAEYASDKYQNGEVTANTFTVGSPFVGFGSYYPQDILNAVSTGAAINKYAGVTSQPQTSRWLGYNTIQLYDMPKDAFIHFVAACQHDLTGETIPESQVESFMRLATLDVERSLYAQLKNMINVGSAYKETQLKIDEWSGAEAARNELIDQWTQTFHLDDSDLIVFF
jgi:hypothetical protein